MSLPFVVSIMGPTGTGKTDLAVELVSQFPFEIISVDSALVYRGMDIGTAKPGKETLQKAPHRLIDIIDPDDVYSAASFRNDALAEIKEITSRGKIPLLVGGTGLYFRALLEGISELPSADVSIRKKLEKQAKELGWQAMHDRLVEIDPVAGERIHPNDPQRIERALEVYEISGKTITSFFEEDQNTDFPYTPINFILEPEDRSWLHKRLSMRFEQMIGNGLIEEVGKIRDQFDLNIESPSMRLVGYRQVLSHLQGELDREAMIEKAVIATRQLAKRQLTWFRSVKQAHRIACDKTHNIHEILQILNNEELFLS
ncbi:MAG: tRNA (adenosine(37)-N6)-dimethylallyltransferase MiaA [Gammaproteobacteria bacterium]